MRFKWPLELKQWPIAVFLLIFTLPLLIKAVRVDVFIYGYTGIWLLGALQVLANDAVIYAVTLKKYTAKGITEVYTDSLDPN